MGVFKQNFAKFTEEDLCGLHPQTSLKQRLWQRPFPVTPPDACFGAQKLSPLGLEKSFLGIIVKL